MIEIDEFMKQIENDEERGLLPKGYSIWVEKSLSRDELAQKINFLTGRQ